MIYVLLFFEFFKIGLFAFGGAYGAIPLIKEAVLRQGWMDEQVISDMIAISESTPGPIMVNSATYVGFNQGGIPGAFLATLGVVLPAFLIILMVNIFLNKWIKSKGVQNVLKGIRPCIMGVILATGIHMLITTIMPDVKMDIYSIIILAVLLAVMWLWKVVTKKGMSPIVMICVSAVCGMILL